MNITFYCRKNRPNRIGLCPIYAKIRVKDKEIQRAVGVHCNPKDWVAKYKTIKNNTIDSKKILDFEIFWTHKYQSSKFVNENVQVFDLVEEVKSNTLISEAFQEFSTDILERKQGTSTLKGNKNKLKYFGEYLGLKFKNKHTRILTRNFVAQYMTYLSQFDFKDSTLNNHNKFINSFCKWINREGYSTSDLSETIVKAPVPNEINFLTPFEINLLRRLKTRSKALERVKDMFVFCVNTGISFCDLEHYGKGNIQMSMDNKEYILIRRKKTKQECYIPLNDEARAISEKYNYNFPTISNQKYNRYLGECCELAGISKRVSSHVARKSCAMYLLNQGMRFETLAKIFGHQSAKMTQQYYARFLPDTVLREYEECMKKLG